MEPKSPNATEVRQHADAQRVYRNDEIAVTWEPHLCIHVGQCFRNLPAVFQPMSRPWVNLDGATAEQIAAVVSRCPSGALHVEWVGGAAADATTDTTIDVRPNGPLLVRGPVRIVGTDGQTLREDSRVALCRCGQSENKPFCDATHRRIGFRAA